MPYKVEKLKGGKCKVTSPHGVKAKGTSCKKAKAQIRLLNALKHDPSFRKRAIERAM